MSIADKLTQLDEIRSSMRTKLVAKGVDASTHNFADFPSDVESIPSGGGTDGQFFPMNMLEYCLPTMELIVNDDYSDFTQATMINISGTNYINNGVFYTPGSGTNCVYYCDLGKKMKCLIVAIKQATSNRFRFCFLDTDPTTLTTDTTGTGYFPADSNSSTPAGTQVWLTPNATQCGRYLVIGVSNENLTTPAPLVYYKEM